MDWLQLVLTLTGAGRAKTTVLRPLAWIITLLLSGTIAAFALKIPDSVGITFLVLLVFCIFLYFYSYIFFMHKDPDQLRTENYSLQRLAIEKGVVGDSLKGVFDSKIGHSLEKRVGAEMKKPDES